MSSRSLQLLVVLLAVVTAMTGCRRETAEPEAFSFVVYPGSRFLGQLTERTKEAHRFINPSAEPPATAIYDSDATIDEVAAFYAKEYGYGQVRAEGTFDDNAKPQAYYFSGDIATDAKGLEDLLERMEIPADLTHATGTYRAAYIAPRRHRPRVTIQRPYFDLTTSEMVDRTLITMSQDR